jgi:hypothetical protein
MKKIFRLLIRATVPLLITLVFPAVYAQSDEQCLLSGNFAKAAADLLHLGQPEEQVLADLRNGRKLNPERSVAQQKMLDERDITLVNWVYTVRPSTQDARAIVYAKCMSGGLGYLDTAKYKVAGKSKQR